MRTSGKRKRLTFPCEQAAKANMLDFIEARDEGNRNT